jgi:hypothetical protein
MGTLYLATPKTSHAITVVATTAALKTVLQVGIPSTTDIRVHGWGISCKGIAAADPAGDVTLIDTDVAATVTTLTPEKFESAFAQNSLCVGGTALTGYNASAEGTITASTILDPQAVHPQAAYGVFFPDGRRPRVGASRFLRIRCLFTVTVNVVPWVLYEEPA